jgi:anthranilate phosphoribosyltransferase
VVHGHDGLDEISTTGSTDVYEVWTGRVEKHIWAPEDFGVPRTTRGRLAGGSPVDNARITRAILGGESGPKRDIVVVNAAAGLMAGGLVKNPREGVAKAAESIDSGSAAAVLEKLQNKFPAF